MSERLRVASYNIQNGTHTEKLGESLKIMQESGVEVFCLQEVWREEIGEELKKGLSDKWESECYPGEKHDTGLALFWDADRLKLLDIERIALPYLEDRNLWEQYITTFPQAPHRGALIGTFQIADQKFRATSVHLDWHGGMGHRLDQLRHLSNYLDRMPTIEHEIICGDFNTIAFSAVTRRQRARLRSVLGEEFHDVLPDISSTVNMQSVDPTEKNLTKIQTVLLKLGISIPQRLDYVFVKGFKVINAALERLDGSNHYPITATLLFR